MCLTATAGASIVYSERVSFRITLVGDQETMDLEPAKTTYPILVVSAVLPDIEVLRKYKHSVVFHKVAQVYCLG